MDGQPLRPHEKRQCATGNWPRQESASELVAELTAAARRSGLEERIAADLAKLSGSSVERSNILLEKAGYLATSHINRFASTLGFDAMPENSGHWLQTALRTARSGCSPAV
ncbi:virulence factor SrfC family protein [Mesorhizobium amorphae]|uniref:virulence factor SrfC family protein n=1 Tax=Mesorhizobium amorphae TaxID=71433 RepID=UPI0024E0D467|nr:virulence factor SrfC family protein [Mesorhizobium amorphae]